MKTQLKTMSEDQLVKRIGACRTMADIKAIKEAAKTELEGADAIVSERVMKAIYSVHQSLIKQPFKLEPGVSKMIRVEDHPLYNKSFGEFHQIGIDNVRRALQNEK